MNKYRRRTKPHQFPAKSRSRRCCDITKSSAFTMTKPHCLTPIATKSGSHFSRTMRTISCRSDARVLSAKIDKEFTKPGEMAFFDDTKQLLAGRIAKLKTGHSWAE